MKSRVREVFAEHTFLCKKGNRYASKNVPLNSLVCLEAGEMNTGHDLFTPLSFSYIFCPLVFLWYLMVSFIIISFFIVLE